MPKDREFLVNGDNHLVEEVSRLTEGLLVPEKKGAGTFEADLPNGFYPKIRELAPEAKKFLAPPSPKRKKVLQLYHDWYNEGEGSRALAVRALLEYYPKRSPHELAMLFLYDDVIEKIGDWDFCGDEWEAFCEKYKERAFVLSGKGIKISSFLKYISFFLVHTFYEEAASTGFSSLALSLLGRALLCNPNLDVKKIYNHVPKTKEWQEEVKRGRVDITLFDTSVGKEVDPYSKFSPDSYRVFVENETSSEESTSSYFWVFCYYRNLRESGVNQEALSFLNNALKLNPELVKIPLLAEGLRHSFVQMRGEVTNCLAGLGKAQQLFDGYGAKPEARRREVWEKAIPEVFEVERAAIKLEQNSVGGVGFFLAAQLYWALGKFAYSVNKRRPGALYPSSYFEAALKNFYLAEYLSDNFPMYTSIMSVYSEFSRGDGAYRDHHARAKLFNNKTAVFFAPEKEARQKAREILQRQYGGAVVLPPSTAFEKNSSAFAGSCGFNMSKCS